MATKLLAFLCLLGFSIGFHTPTGEICNNAVDDDLDGLIDLNDLDCNCPVIEPVSLIPNPSFEEMNCCPNNRSQLNCAGTWIQASEATTDYVHSCGWDGWQNLPAPRPFPDGEAVIGFRNGRFGMNDPNPNWKEYTGACLLSPMKKGTSYRFQFNIGFTNPDNSPPIDVTFFGSIDCANLPFGVGNSRFGCPTNGPGWTNLGSVKVSGGNSWLTTYLSITPVEDIVAIAIGPDCVELNWHTDTYYFFDNLLLADQKSFEFVISGNGKNPCSPVFSLQVPEESGSTYQWYKNGIAIVGETQAQLSKNRGEGPYQVMIQNASECRVTKVYNYIKPRVYEDSNVIICEGEVYAFSKEKLSETGVFVDTFITKDGCDSIVTLNLKVETNKAHSLNAKIFEGENYQVGHFKYKNQGNFLAGLQTIYGCDSLVDLTLSYYHVFMPTAFSPNDDGINDFFSIQGGQDLVAIPRLTVFDRWGSMVYDGKDLGVGDRRAGWNGMIEGKPAESGIYVFMTEVMMDDGKVREKYGEIVLLR